MKMGNAALVCHEDNEEYVLDAADREVIDRFIKDNCGHVHDDWRDEDEQRCDTRIFHKTA